MWIRKPMNVMTRHITPDSASIRNARSMCRSPVAIQVMTTSDSPPGPASGSTKKKPSIATMQAAPMASAATMNTVSRDHLRPNNISTAAPRKRSNRIRPRLKFMAAGSPSALHHRRVIEVDALSTAEQAHQDGQPDGRLGGCQRDDQEREHVPLLIPQLAREREQGQVAAVELQLDGHQHDQRVPSQQHAGGADQKQDERQQQVVGGGDVHQWCPPGAGSSSCAPGESRVASSATCLRLSAARCAETSFWCERETTTPPTIATSNSSEIASNGYRNSRNSMSPTEATVPYVSDTPTSALFIGKSFQATR